MNLIVLKFVKYLVFVFCTGALTYQSFYSYMKYKEYQTLVTIDIEKPLKIGYPGVSVCLANPLANLTDRPFDIKHFPISRGLYNFVKKTIPNIRQKINEGLTYKDALNIFVGNDVRSINEIFDFANDNLITCEFRKSQPCHYVNRIMGFFTGCKVFFGSYMFNDTSKVKLNTSFGYIEESSTNKMAIIKIKRNSSMVHKNQLTVLVHPSNAIPLFKIQKLALRQNKLKFGRQYDLTFTKDVIEKKGNPYKPICQKYDDEFKSQSHCISKCVHSRFYDKYNCVVFGLDKIYEGELRNYKLCNAEQNLKTDFNWVRQTLYNCSTTICLPNCYEEIYTYEVKDVTDSPATRNETTENDTIVINLMAQQYDEFTYLYHPIIDQNDLITKFGGLLSLWLGFSFYSIYKQLEKWSKHLFKSLQTTKNKVSLFNVLIKI